MTDLEIKDVSEQDVVIRVIDTAEQFEELREEWDQLLEVAEDASVFVSWEWLFNWWRYYGKDRRLRILVALERGRLVGILPIYVQTIPLYRYFPVRVSRFVGIGGDTSPDYLGPLLVPESAERVARALAGHVLDRLQEWDVLYLTDLSEGSLFRRVLAEQSSARGLTHTSNVSASIAYILLPQSWDDYLAGVHRDRRYTIRNTRKKFETLHGGKFYVWSEGDGGDAILDRLIELHRRRWQEKGEHHAFSTPEYVGFHRDVIHACARRGWIRFYCIETHGAPLAAFYCYRFRNQIFYFQVGFNPEFEKLRPGLVLIGYAVEHAIQEGNTAFDFLRGEHMYKTQWGKSLRHTHALTIYRSSLVAQLYRLREERIPAAKTWLKQRFPFLLRLRREGRIGHGTSVKRAENA